MNLILLEPAAPDAHGGVTISGAKARHLLKVLRVRAGDTLRVGLVDGPEGTAEVVRIEESSVDLRCRFGDELPRLPEDVLVLAIPRPTVLARCLEHAAALGFGRIALLRTWRTDKSHLGTRVLEPEQLRAHLVLGLEQARRTRLPRVEVHDRFRPFVEDRLPELAPPKNRFVAHPNAKLSIAGMRPEPEPLALVIGPERGLLDYEVEKLAEVDFVAVRRDSHPLRVETALAAIYAQLDVLRSAFAQAST